MYRRYNSKEKEFFILEILRNKNIARFHEIKEYVRENLKKKQNFSGDTTSKAKYLWRSPP